MLSVTGRGKIRRRGASAVHVRCGDGALKRGASTAQLDASVTKALVPSAALLRTQVDFFESLVVRDGDGGASPAAKRRKKDKKAKKSIAANSEGEGVAVVLLYSALQALPKNVYLRYRALADKKSDEDDKVNDDDTKVPFVVFADTFLSETDDSLTESIGVESVERLTTVEALEAACCGKKYNCAGDADKISQVSLAPATGTGSGSSSSLAASSSSSSTLAYTEHWPQHRVNKLLGKSVFRGTLRMFQHTWQAGKIEVDVKGEGVVEIEVRGRYNVNR